MVMPRSKSSLCEDTDQDSLFILPLSIVPLKTKGLKRARLVKNSRLEGMIELFSGDETGSGQVTPSGLERVFQFTEENVSDLDMIRNLSTLGSYDIFSLRIELRRLGLEVDDVTVEGEGIEDVVIAEVVDFQAKHRQLVSQLLGFEVRTDPFTQPGFRNLHRDYLNCLRKRRSFSKNVRRSETP